ncbi:LytR/AlgR family response regulator transcription factor [Chitinophagaceae bacterium MMS25-I14]
MKVVIVEDEAAARQYLENFLNRHFPQVIIAAVPDNVPDAVSAINLHRPDIVFMDIDIKMGSGFDVLAALPEIKSEIIFTTAFNQFAIDAFKYHAVDYLLKPLQDTQVADAVRHSISRIEQKNSSQQVVQLLQFLQQPALQKQRISIHTMDGIEFLDVDDILFAEAKGNYTELKLRAGTKLVTSKKLKEVEQQLVAAGFFRIHHSYVVNTRYIRKYYKGRGGSVQLIDETVLPVAVTRRDEFLRSFGGDD